jgi:hypothetical protein
MRVRMKIVLAAALAAAVAALVVPGVAQADGTGDFCNSNGSGLCVSMNGTQGDLVYGKTPAIDQEQDTVVAAYPACFHGGQPSIYVQALTRPADEENCPFTDVKLDQLYVGEEIVTIDNDPNITYAQGTAAGQLVQAAVNGSGELFIKDANVYVQVSRSDSQQESMYMCAAGVNKALTLLSSQAGCAWNF